MELVEAQNLVYELVNYLTECVLGFNDDTRFSSITLEHVEAINLVWEKIMFQEIVAQMQEEMEVFMGSLHNEINSLKNENNHRMDEIHNDLQEQLAMVAERTITNDARLYAIEDMVRR